MNQIIETAAHRGRMHVLTRISTSLLLVSMILLSASGCRAQDPDEENWIQLFNGSDIEDWDVKLTGRELTDNFGDTFRVQDGILKVVYDAYESFNSDFGMLMYKKPYSYYIIAVEYRFTGEQLAGGPGWALRNSGIMIHSQSAESMLKNQDFPISIEVQLLGGTGEGERTTANLCTPGTNVVMHGQLVTRHCINSTSATYDGDQWVRVEVEVLGDSLITHRIAGSDVLSYSKPQIGGGVVENFNPAFQKDGQILTSGFIGLQSESHPIEFRKVELLNLAGCLDPAARNFKSYFVQFVPDDCIYR